MKRGVNWLIFGACGVIIIIAVVLVDIFLIPWGIHYQVSQELALVNGSDAWNRWAKLPFPIYFKLYMFQVENPFEVMMHGAKPRVTEVGPFVYSETREKIIVAVNESADTVIYYQRIIYKFDEERSKPLKENDVITMVNPALVGIMQVLEGMPVVSALEGILEYGLPPVLGGMTTGVMNMSVNDFVFGGIPLICNHTQPTSAPTRLFCSAIRQLMPMRLFEEVDGNFLFALLKFKNNTLDGPYEVKRGVKKIEELGSIIAFKGSNLTDAWLADSCNRVVGTDMALVSPFIDKGAQLKIFSSDICTSTKLVYDSDIEYRQVPGYKYVPSPEFLGSVTDFPENYCFCPSSILGVSKPNGCLKKGAIDVSGCLEVPGIVTFPHLLGASPDYQATVDGLKPDPAIHSTFLEVEPTTGVPLRGYERVQVNILTKPTPIVTPLKNMPYSLFPVCWFEEGLDLPDEFLSIVRDQLLKVLYIVNIVKWVLIAAGIVMAIVGGTMGAIRLLKDKK